MNALHLTSHVGTINNIQNVFRFLNIESQLTTQSSIYTDYYMNETAADEVWKHYADKLDNFKFIIFTDTSMVARPFLQNIQHHKCILIVYITNRFDWGIWGNTDDSYYQLYSEMSKHDRVIFCADNGYDQYYAKQRGIQFLYEEPIKLTPIISADITRHMNDRFFIYNRGSKINNYKDFLHLRSFKTPLSEAKGTVMSDEDDADCAFSMRKGVNERNIDYDVYGEEHQRFRDTEHICEYKGFIHLPYQTNIQSLWENLGYSIVYFIPSKKFLIELITTTEWYYWEEKKQPEPLFTNSIDLSEWYANEDVFVYFDSWDDLKFQTETITDKQLYNKQLKIRHFIETSNRENIQKWKYMLSDII